MLPQLVFGQRLRIGIDDNHALRAVDDHQFVFADQLARVVQRDDRRDVEAAGDDRGVRCGATQIGDEARELVLFELDHVCRRQVVRDQDQVLFVARALRWRVAGLAEQYFHQAFDDLDDVGFALAQIAVFDLVELVEQRVELHFQRPFGIALFGCDDFARRFRQRRVVQYHQVQVEEGVELLRRIGRNLRAQFLQFGAHRRQGSVEARQFLGDLGLRHHVMRDLEPGMGHQVRVSDGDAAGYRNAVQGKAHCAGAGET